MRTVRLEVRRAETRGVPFSPGFLCKQSSDNLIRHFAIGIAPGIPRSLFIEHCFQNDFHDNVHCERILSNDYGAEQKHLFKQFKKIAYDYRASILIKSGG